VLQRQHLHGRRRRHVRVAVAIAAGPGAEAQRRRRHGQVDTEASEDGGDVGQHLRDGQPLGVDQVEHRVPGLVDRLGPLPPELVGQPQQVDDLGEVPVGPFGEVGPGRAGGLGRLRVEEVGEGMQLGERRSPRRLGGMSGEHRPHLELARDALELPPPVHLFDDVGQVEVGVEGAHQPGRGLLVDVAQQLGGRGRIGTGERADRLDELEQLWTLLAHEGVAQQGADAPDVDAQGKVRVIC
jgi:hypothetical protein